jgi:hypothetical protein
MYGRPRFAKPRASSMVRKEITAMYPDFVRAHARSHE